MISLDNSIVQSQKMIFAPKLVESLKILQIQSGDLTKHIEEELKENPLLELAQSEEISNKIQGETDYLPKDSFFQSFSSPLPVADEFLSYVKKQTSLRDFLMLQLIELKISPIYRNTLLFIIESIDEDGYLKEDIKDLTNLLKTSSQVIKTCIKIIQTMEPAGVGARDIRECILIQLRRKKLLTTDWRNIVLNYFKLLARRSFSDIAKKTGLETQEVIHLYNLIKQLSTKPGASFISNDYDEYIIPDLFISEIGGKFYAEYNNESIPSIQISNYYKSLLKSPDSSVETKDYIKKRFYKAALLIESINLRKKTMIQIAEYIINYQCVYMKKGFGSLKPLTMKNVADGLKISESTVSRTVSGKYIQSIWGVHEMNFFFSVKLGDSIESCISAFNAKDMIKKIVQEENKQKPTSDEQIKALLESNGVKIARRTIAKYREELSILPTSLRRIR